MTDGRESFEDRLCAEVEEHLAALIDGHAPDRLLDHIADCDRCRDARHDAERAREAARAAGADFTTPADFEARIVAAIGEHKPVSQPETSTTLPSAKSTASTDQASSAEPAVAPEPESADDESEPKAKGAEPEPESAAEDRAPAPEAASSDRPIAQKQARGSLLAFVKKHRKATIAGGIVALAAAAAAGIALRPGKGPAGDQHAADTWRGKVARVSSAAGGKKGLELCDPTGKSCSTLAAGAIVPAGSVLRTDERTRAYVSLDDGSELALDRATEIALSGDKERRARVEHGGIVFDVSHIEGHTARLDVPRGWVEVLGTKFSLRASSDSAAVDVSRGSVKLIDADKRSVVVRAGEEGRIYPDMPPYASAAPTLASSLAWSEAAVAEPGQEIRARGLGELKAKKPSSDQELDRAVTLTSHAVKVRIAGAVARTEVDETFTNHTSDVLEGIYRFPLPPDAKIERLALEVDGKIEEGAFVDRERAAAIWRGAIVNAAPQIKNQIRDEIVWVPGPWRDPALLEWQRGGRFELRIYPIPKNGSRRVILAYSQLIRPTGGVRRYSYPLAHDPSGSTKVSRFSVEVQVRGHDEKLGVTSDGYELAKSSSAGADVLTMSAQDFVPAGDLTLEYALPDRNAELAVWSYEMSADEKATAAADKAKAATLATSAPSAKTAPSVALQGGDAYVALALRPKLPRSADEAHRAFVIVVDSSRSMFGESYTRASRLAARLVREIDPLDRVTVLACDTDCRAMPSGLQTPGAELAVEAERFLGGIAPEGASDPSAAIKNAVATSANANGRELRIVYVGDGTPTVGPIRPAWIARDVEKALPPGRGSVTAVAVGADSDLDSLSALARGGGGVVLPYVPGETTAEAAFAVLGASYGSSLRDVHVELPEGLVEAAPKQLDSIPAGGESLIVARLSKPDVTGTVVLRGKLGNQSFEQRYPVKIVPTSSRGNAFVPRLYAAARIADLERDPNADSKKQAIELSQAFNVASRHTSLLVLESTAMFRAFGLDNARRAPEWTGEEAAEVSTASGEIAVDDGARLDAVSPYGDTATTKGGRASAKKAGGGSTAAAAGFDAPASGGGGFGLGAGPAPAAAPRPSPAPKVAVADEARKSAAPPAKEEADKPRATNPPQPFDADRRDAIIAENQPRMRPPRRWIPMRRVFERVGSVTTDRLTPKTASRSAIADAESALAQNENRRDLVKKLYTLHALAGDLEQASTLAERWSSKEPLDPEALTARADLAARSGDRELAIRVLGSVVDVRPGDVKAQKRLARLQRWAGRPAVGCRHSIAVSELHPADGTLLADAVRCARATGESALGDDLFLAADAATRKVAEAQLDKPDGTLDALSGDLKVEASWSGGQDLDLGLLDPDGNRVSWLGAPTRAVITAQDVVSTSREALSLRGGKAGEYVVEVVRGTGSGPVRGELVVTAAGTRRVVPFTLDGSRVTVAIARIDLKERLVPLD